MFWFEGAYVFIYGRLKIDFLICVGCLLWNYYCLRCIGAGCFDSHVSRKPKPFCHCLPENTFMLLYIRDVSYGWQTKSINSPDTCIVFHTSTWESNISSLATKRTRFPHWNFHIWKSTNTPNAFIDVIRTLSRSLVFNWKRSNSNELLFASYFVGRIYNWTDVSVLPAINWGHHQCEAKLALSLSRSPFFCLSNNMIQQPNFTFRQTLPTTNFTARRETDFYTDTNREQKKILKYLYGTCSYRL